MNLLKFYCSSIECDYRSMDNKIIMIVIIDETIRKSWNVSSNLLFFHRIHTLSILRRIVCHYNII